MEGQEEDERARNIQREWSDRVTRKGGSGAKEGKTGRDGRDRDKERDKQ